MQLMEEEGIYIVMNGVFASHEKVRKDRKNGKFVCQ
jgi:hypothetical protein